MGDSTQFYSLYKIEMNFWNCVEWLNMFFAVWPKNLTPTASLGPFLAFGLFKSFLRAIFVQGMFLRISKITDKELISVNAKIERFFSWFAQNI